MSVFFDVRRLGLRASNARLLFFGPSMEGPLRRIANRQPGVALSDLERLYRGSYY